MPKHSHASAFDNVHTDEDLEVSEPKAPEPKQGRRKDHPDYKQIGPVVRRDITADVKAWAEKRGLDLSEVTERLYIALLEGRVDI